MACFAQGSADFHGVGESWPSSDLSFGFNDMAAGQDRLKSGNLELLRSCYLTMVPSLSRAVTSTKAMLEICGCGPGHEKMTKSMAESTSVAWTIMTSSVECRSGIFGLHSHTTRIDPVSLTGRWIMESAGPRTRCLNH